jgi:hypothetical protein
LLAIDVHYDAAIGQHLHFNPVRRERRSGEAGQYQANSQ